MGFTYYTYSQNFLNGVRQRDMVQHVVVEANNPVHADKVASAHGVYFDVQGRWSRATSNSGSESPQINSADMWDYAEANKGESVLFIPTNHLIQLKNYN